MALQAAPLEVSPFPGGDSGLTCTACSYDIANFSERLQHYRTEWHRLRAMVIAVLCGTCFSDMLLWSDLPSDTMSSDGVQIFLLLRKMISTPNSSVRAILPHVYPYPLWH